MSCDGGGGGEGRGRTSRKDEVGEDGNKAKFVSQSHEQVLH